MRQLGSILPEELTNIDSFNPETPAIVQKALKRLERNISQNVYDTHNYKSMILKCTHLDSSQQDKLLELFSSYDSLFDGSLGKVPNIKVHLDLKPNSKPFCARAYKIPNHIFDIARKEVEELCRLGALQADVHSEWGAPCLFCAKKNDGVRFITDLRYLNRHLIRKPVHLPLIDEVLWKVQSFSFATCLDLNRGYYHFELDEPSKVLCGIILPWGRYVYNRLPQGCTPSSDIFQGHMVKTFYDFEDVIVYIDNIILFTKSSFQHHLQRLALVLDRIKSQNLHIHVEETFLATNQVDYLGYTVSSKGIKPQNQKILAILDLAPPTNKRQLCSFLGFVNFYRQLWYHCSHIITPLTSITSDKSKWVWGPTQQQAFLDNCNTIAWQVLLKYPDFTQPFDVYTDASDYQLGSVISQNAWPVAFYSRKLTPAQKNYTTMEKELLSIIKTS
jgi:RNase H-like domain found in reverse transcriptase/Reverse transcriptase (RNA-dependent DNA polymerase)